MPSRFSIYFSLAMVLASLSCQKPPSVAISARPSEHNGPPPMGAKTLTKDLKERAQLLERFLAGDLPISAMEAAGFPKEMVESLGLQSIDKKKNLSQADQKYHLARLYFEEHRFIEAAHLFSTVLDNEPHYKYARNYLARCFYLLGNPDRTIDELAYVLTQNPSNADEVLDALYLMGAASLEAQYMATANMKKGLGAWETYLKIAPESEQKQTVSADIETLRKKVG